MKRLKNSSRNEVSSCIESNLGYYVDKSGSCGFAVDAAKFISLFICSFLQPLIDLVANLISIVTFRLEHPSSLLFSQLVFDLTMVVHLPQRRPSSHRAVKNCCSYFTCAFLFTFSLLKTLANSLSSLTVPK